METVRITRASAEALDRVRDLWLELHHHHQAVGGAALGPYVGDEASWRARRAFYERLLAGPHGGFLLLAEREAQAVGYAMVAVSPVRDSWLEDTWRIGPLFAEIETMVVTAGVRGQGVGGRLLDRIDDELAGAGVRDVLVGAFATNAEAVRLYERRGFRPASLYMIRLARRT